VRALGSVLLWQEDVPNHTLTAVRVFHPSFRDFILDRPQAHPNFCIDIPTHHSDIANRCLEVLNTHLRQNICDIASPSIANSDVDHPVLSIRLRKCAPDLVFYACSYWLFHLALAVNPSSTTKQALRVFTTSHLLHWIELLSLLSQLSHAMELLFRLTNIWFQVCAAQQVHSFRFLQ
jgi:hypothetical protein